MPADDIFILLLVIVCVAIVVGAAVHSRRKHQPSVQSEAVQELPDATEPPPIRAGSFKKRHSAKATEPLTIALKRSLEHTRDETP